MPASGSHVNSFIPGLTAQGKIWKGPDSAAESQQVWARPNKQCLPPQMPWYSGVWQSHFVLYFSNTKDSDIDTAPSKPCYLFLCCGGEVCRFGRQSGCFSLSTWLDSFGVSVGTWLREAGLSTLLVTWLSHGQARPSAEGRLGPERTQCVPSKKGILSVCVHLWEVLGQVP